MVRMLKLRSHHPELMDDPALDLKSYASVLSDLTRVSNLTMSNRPVLSFLKRAVGRGTHFRLLDVGFGSGDMLRDIARWASANGFTADLAGVDLNPHSRPIAQALTPAHLNIEFITGDYQRLDHRSFDFIVSSLVAHHMTHGQLVEFLRFMEQHAKRGWLINDLRRHAVAYLGFPLLATALRCNPIVRHDGRLSIARSYRLHEWRPLLEEAEVSGATVLSTFLFRLCVERLKYK